MKHWFKRLTMLCCLLTAVAASAGPAPWWLWESVNGKNRACSQTPLGPGWRKLLGPYKDARCEKLIRVQ